jgi:hypothetical protein
VSLLTLANRKPPVDKAVQRWTLQAVSALVTAYAKKGRPRMRGASWSRSCIGQRLGQGVEWVRVPPCPGERARAPLDRLLMRSPAPHCSWTSMCASARDHVRILRHADQAVTMEIYANASSTATREALRRLGDSLH